MKLKIPTIKTSRIFISFKYMYGLLIIILVGVSVILGMFLYKNFYQTIAQSEEIILLKKEVAPDVVDIEKVNNIIQIINKKNNPTTTADWQNIKNPFHISLPAIEPESESPSE